MKACFIDIDATITDDGNVCQIDPKHPVGNALFGVLRDIMVQDGWERDKAVAALVAHANEIVFWDYKDFIREFNLPVEHAWDQIIKWHDDHLVVYEDAVAMVKQLHAMNLPLYIISNNSVLGCLLKLQRAGLGTLEGTPWFKDIFGSSNVCGQKYSLNFWKRALALSGCSPEEIVVIGDDPKEDFQVPFQAGVRHFIQIDRKRKEPVVHRGGAYLVNSLDQVGSLIAAQSYINA